MQGIPQGWITQSHRTLVRVTGTTQKEGSMPSSYQKAWGRVWAGRAGTFFFVVLNILVIYPSSGETRGFFTVLTNQHVGTELQGLKPHHVLLTSERASSAMVGTIMALLATFEEAGVLPPEGTAQANQVIHGLIQLQSAVMKSPSSELAAYRKAAIAHWASQHKEREGETIGDEGLTARMLAALIAYDLEHPLWENSKVVSAMQMFNVTYVDWMLIVELFHQAEAVLHAQGHSIYMVYENWRMNMPGGKS